MSSAFSINLKVSFLNQLICSSYENNQVLYCKIMNFKERFKGRIATVDKKGLKLALMKPTKPQPLIDGKNQQILRQISLQSSNLQRANWRRMAKPTRFPQSKTVQNEESFSSFKKLNTQQQYFIPNLKKKQSFFIEQLQEKHINFLKKLQRRTRYNTVTSR